VATLARLDIVITASTGQLMPGLKGATNGLQGVERQATRTKRTLGGLGAAFKAVFAAAIIRQIARASVAIFNLGASVEETQSKFSTVFAKSADDVQQFLDVFANKAGLTNREAQNLLATTGAIAQGMGFAVEASAAYAKEVAVLAADITSFNDVAGGTAVVIEAINAAAAGERERLKQWGIQILDVDVKTRALMDTGKTAASELTAQEKVAATLAVIYDRVGVAVGDLDRTQLSAANTARRVSSRLREIGETASSAVLPIFGQLLGALDDNASAFDAVTEAIGVVGRAINVGIAWVQLFGVTLAVMAAKSEVVWAKVKDAASKALLGSGVAGILLRFEEFMQGLSPTVQAILGLNPIVASARGLASLVESDTGLAVTIAEGNFLRMQRSAEESAEGILKALNAALTQSGVVVPDRPAREGADQAAKDAARLAAILGKVQSGLREIAAMEGIDAPFDLARERIKLIEGAVRSLAAAGLTNTVEFVAFREELERLRIGIVIIEGIEEAAEGLEGTVKNTTETVSKLEAAATSFADNFADRMADSLREGASAWKGFADSVIVELNRIAVKLAIINIVRSLAPENDTLLSIVGANPKGRATGGLLTPLKPVKVHRDEVIVPLVPSMAIPASVAARGGGGGGGPQVSIHIPLSIQALDGPGARQAGEQLRPLIAETVVDAMRNSGAFRRTLGR